MNSISLGALSYFEPLDAPPSRDWLTRLRTAGDCGEHIARVFHAGELPIPTTTDVLALEPRALVQHVPGATGPVSSSVLTFLDTLPVSEQTLQLTEELGALLCIASGRRVFAPTEIPLRVKDSDAPTTFATFSRGLDRELIGPLPADTLQRSIALLQHISRLSESDLTTLSGPFMLYYGACQIIESDVRSAYVLLVAALEVLSREFGNPPTDWAGWEEADSWDRAFLRLGLLPAQSEELRKKLLVNKFLRLGRTFCQYVIESLGKISSELLIEQWSYTYFPPTASWSSGTVTSVPLGAFLPTDRKVLEKALAKTYETRSAYVHKGHSFSISESLRPQPTPSTGSEPIPYPVLRVIVRELLILEISARAKHI